MENNVNAIFEGLNDEQSKAVACVEGPVLIVAGAGSGKTKVLTCRIANILAKGCEPDRILALTFTKKAASEMKERISLMVGERRARRLVMGTFHSVFIRFLRDYAGSLGYPQNFTVYDTSDSTSAIKACIKELKLDDKTYKPKDVLARISMAKNNLVTVAAYRANSIALTNDRAAKRPMLVELYDLYTKKCKQSGVMDFDDILLNMNILLRDHPEALKEIAARFSYIMVDEYQDTNFAQYLILKKLSQFHRNLCVVGDDSQSIYAFRGAKVENILNFKKDYPDCHIYRLERNYRSTQVIVDAANSLIAKNSNRIPKTCYAVGDKGEQIHLIRSDSESDEAKRIASGIKNRIYQSSSRYEDFAILYRTNSQSRALEDALRGFNIPYIIYSGNSFFDRAEVKDMMAYFKLVVNLNDDESFKRIVNKPARSIGDTTIEALGNAARAHGLSLFHTISCDDLPQYGLKTAGITSLQKFSKMIAALSAQVEALDALELAKLIADDTGYYASQKADTSIEGQSRVANISELLNSVASYVERTQNDYVEDMQAEGFDSVSEEELPLVRLDQYLENISLLSTVDMTDEEDASNRVSMMTVHSSKGLEFKHVYIAGLEDNLFPSGSMVGAIQDIEEERRLFYVAVTRAKVSVDLSFASSRMRNGNHEYNPPSRFIREIDSKYIDKPLDDSDFSAADGGFGHSGFSRFGSRSEGGRSNSYGNGSSYSGAARPSYNQTQGPRGSNYGRSSEVRYEKRSASTSPAPAAPAAKVSRPVSSTARPAPAPVKNRYDENTFVPSRMVDFKIGQKVEHLKFGPGRILEMEGNFPDIKAKIAFDDYPEPKVIMLKYSKVRIAE